MKITKIETLEIDLSGQNGLDLWRPIYVRIHTDEGISGMGEASLAYGTASEAIAPMIRILAERFLLGQDLMILKHYGKSCDSVHFGP